MSGFVSIGECMIELSARESACCRIGFAGDTFNTAWCVRGCLPGTFPVRYYTAFGDDPFSIEQRSFFEKNEIDANFSVTIEGAHPGLYAVSLDEYGERTFTYWREASAARQLASTPNNLSDCLRDMDVAYFSGITLSILDVDGRETVLDQVRRARAAGVRIAFDPNYRGRLWEGIRQARYWNERAEAVCDVILTTKDDLTALYGDVDTQRVVASFVNHGVSEVVVKNGSQAATLWYEGRFDSVPALQVEVCDTTGAGDSFNGAYIAARIAGNDAKEAALLGHRVAARAVGTFGALVDLNNVFDLTGGVTHD